MDDGLEKLSIKQLKSILEAKKIDFSDCFEKFEVVLRAREHGCKMSDLETIQIPSNFQQPQPQTQPQTQTQTQSQPQPQTQTQSDFSTTISIQQKQHEFKFEEMSIGELKSFLKERSVSSFDCFEKSDLINKAKSVAHLPPARGEQIVQRQQQQSTQVLTPHQKTEILKEQLAVIVQQFSEKIKTLLLPMLEKQFCGVTIPQINQQADWGNFSIGPIKLGELKLPEEHTEITVEDTKITCKINKISAIVPEFPWSYKKKNFPKFQDNATATGTIKNGCVTII
eukprot:TRINITY_DN51_c0_g3_i3.p1 TRINITY_DN51_c0_g3~~TRINITY_DN51_c0_g3_i3.p1  ORF type:complete len:282 (-),score=128.14 TRINITY_DN51_c0_g3_i3:431-1276(-)